jgi:hypothetical protein
MRLATTSSLRHPNGPTAATLRGGRNIHLQFKLHWYVGDKELGDFCLAGTVRARRDGPIESCGQVSLRDTSRVVSQSPENFSLSATSAQTKGNCNWRWNRRGD